MLKRQTQTLTLLLTMCLVACCGSQGKQNVQEPCPPPPTPIKEYLPGPVQYCIQKKFRDPPELPDCPNPKDYTPNSCPRNNTSKLLDYYEALYDWKLLVDKLCKTQ